MKSKKSKVQTSESFPVVETVPDPEPLILPPTEPKVLHSVHYLKLAHPIDIWRNSSFYAEQAECPRVHLVEFHGQLMWKIGGFRLLPFNNAVEFVLDPSWNRSVT